MPLRAGRSKTVDKKACNSRLLTEDFRVFWRLQSSCLLFRGAPWTTDAGPKMHMCPLGLGFPLSISILHPIVVYYEGLSLGENLMRGESYTYLGKVAHVQRATYLFSWYVYIWRVYGSVGMHVPWHACGAQTPISGVDFPFHCGLQGLNSGSWTCVALATQTSWWSFLIFSSSFWNRYVVSKH